jgi:hypothetical protein
MYFNVPEYMAANPFSDIVPYRLFDPATGNVIGGVIEFDDDEGWFRVACRREGRERDGTNTSITHVLTLPFQVVPYFNGIDDLPVIYFDSNKAASVS